MNSHDPVDAEVFRGAMRRTASGVTVLSTDGAAGRAGITVSTLCSLSMDPPSVVVCIHRDNRALAAILENGVFVANVLAYEQSRVADAFAGLIPELREDRYAAGEWHPMATGAPALDEALCRFDCRVADVFEFGSHLILAGAVVAVETCDATPLVFSDRAYRRLHA